MERNSLEIYDQPASRRDHLSQHFESTGELYEPLVEQSQRVGDTLRVFASEKLMSDRAVDTARLQAFVDYVQDESVPQEVRRDIAYRTMDYLTDPTQPVDAREVEYMFALWSDLPKIDSAASNYQKRLEQYGTDESLAVIGKLEGRVALEPDDWDAIRVGVDVPKIVELSEHVNVESILARSALVLDRVATATKYDSELLKDILAIETTYAPLLDLLGLPAWEAILRHHAEKARLLATGREEDIAAYNEASGYIESVRGEELVDTVIGDVVGIDLKEHDFNFIINNEETPYGSKSYFSSIRYVNGNNTPARFISRIKSPGSYARKTLHNYEGEKPLDVFAGTIIVENLEDMAAAFKEVYENIKRLPSCELKTAPSKEHPVHLRGQEAYVETIQAGLGEEFADHIDIREEDEAIEEPFQVLKVTFVMNVNDTSLPVELQFQTRKDRARARLGGASHLCFKDKNGNGLPGNVPGGHADLRHVNNRKWAMLEGGEDIYYEVDAAAKQRQLKEVRALQAAFMERLDDRFAEAA